MSDTYSAGEKVRLLPEQKEVKFVGVVQGHPLVSDKNLGTFQTTWDRIEKLEAPPPVIQEVAFLTPQQATVEIQYPATEPLVPEEEPLVLSQRDGEILADILENDAEPSPALVAAAQEAKATLVPEIPNRITKKWLCARNAAELQEIITQDILKGTRLRKIQDELRSRL